MIPEQESHGVVPAQAKVVSVPAPEQPKAEPMVAPIAETKTPRLPEMPQKAPAPIVPEPAPEIEWLGEAVKGTYLLFQVNGAVFQQLPQHAFLQKVLAAVGLATNQVKFGNLAPSLTHDVKQIAAKYQAKAILLFGQGLPVANLSKMEFYRMYRSENSRFVLVDSLEDIEKSVELKKKLWEVLQKIFLQQN